VGSGPLSNLVDPAILFFFLGLGIAALRSNLEIPQPVVKLCSLYLLLAIGFKGGQALAASGLDGELARVLLAAIVLALSIPALAFVVLRRRTDPFDAAAIAATYGSVSAVTFIAASSYLTRQGTEFSGAMTVALVVMESPAIIMAVFLAAWVRARHRSHPTKPTDMVDLTVAGADATHAVPRAVGAAVANASPVPIVPDHRDDGVSLKPILHEAFTDGAHLLLIGSMIVGLLTTAEGAEAMAPFTEGLFKGILALFLLEMGLLVARELRNIGSIGGFLTGFGVAMPLTGAALAIAFAHLLGLEPGNAVLLAVLAASGSYIVVPAVIRYAIPEARPSRYFGLALGVTFPFNLAVGIPLYDAVVTRIW
jgi:uncharacterized protein